jgi:putative peptidoglycan lipid II flippase
VEVVLGIFIISISTVILPALSEKASRGDREGMKASLAFALRLVFLVTLPATFGLMALGAPIVRMLFRYGAFGEQSTGMVAYALAFQSLGLCGVGGTRVIVQMFFSMKDTRTPVYVAVATMAVNLGLCYLLRIPLRLGGIALAGSIASYVNFFLLLAILDKRVGRIVDRELAVSVLKGIAASALMAGPLFYAVHALGARMEASRLANAAITLLLLCGGLVLFFVFSVILKNGDLLTVKNMLVKKIAGRARGE